MGQKFQHAWGTKGTMQSQEHTLTFFLLLFSKNISSTRKIILVSLDFLRGFVFSKHAKRRVNTLQTDT